MNERKKIYITKVDFAPGINPKGTVVLLSDGSELGGVIEVSESADLYSQRITITVNPRIDKNAPGDEQ